MAMSFDTGPAGERDLRAGGDVAPSAASHTSERTAVGPQLLEQISGINVMVARKAGVYEVSFSDAAGTIKIYPDGKFALTGSLKTPDHKISVEAGDAKGVLGIYFIERGFVPAVKRGLQELIGAEGATRDHYARLTIDGEKVSFYSTYTSWTTTLAFGADGGAARESKRA